CYLFLRPVPQPDFGLQRGGDARCRRLRATALQCHEEQAGAAGARGGDHRPHLARPPRFRTSVTEFASEKSPMSASPHASEQAEPNLTPILDMVFQLITFFMLVINFQSAALDMSLKLPVVGSARPVEGQSEELMVLNVNNKGQLRVTGQTVEAEGFLAKEAAFARKR